MIYASAFLSRLLYQKFAMVGSGTLYVHVRISDNMISKNSGLGSDEIESIDSYFLIFRLLASTSRKLHKSTWILTTTSAPLERMFMYHHLV